jgi:hypothetical protein
MALFLLKAQYAPAFVATTPCIALFPYPKIVFPIHADL